MLSIIITTHREEETIGRAIKAFLAQKLPREYELLVVCPDGETASVVSGYMKLNDRIKCLRDKGKGKPIALNLALHSAVGELVMLSDGDVYVGDRAVSVLLAPFADPQVGAVSGRPVSISPRDTMLGYWSHLLVNAGAHHRRTLRADRGEFLECSGYLYAFRRSTTYQDWMRQKIRSMGGYVQPYLEGSPGTRSFLGEAMQGAWKAISYAQSLRELWWTLLLFVARVHAWLRVWWDIKWRQKPFADVWKRVDSTK
jgi:glycosyltransferase involved in cell wall biosynthesis